MKTDPFDLVRFVSAQEPIFESALEELRAGRKRSHWMWFVFPQLRGLGQSPTAVKYGIRTLDEARAYLAHPILGPRLQQATRAVADLAGTSLRGVFGFPDDLKFCSSMTLFAVASSGDESIFRRAIVRHCNGQEDWRTLDLLGRPDK